MSGIKTGQAGPEKFSSKELLNKFFNDPISKEDTVVLMNGENNKTFIKFIEHEKARLLLERMSQIGEDKEYVFALKVLGMLQNNLKNIFPAVKEYKFKKQEEEKAAEEEKKRNQKQ